jgi:hypothetical protein
MSCFALPRMIPDNYLLLFIDCGQLLLQLHNAALHAAIHPPKFRLLPARVAKLVSTIS